MKHAKPLYYQDRPPISEHVRDGLTLKLTCAACPEQYDAFCEGRLVGYLRLRHGKFTVTCPSVGGEHVYANNTQGDGIFVESERDQELNNAVAAIHGWIRDNSIYVDEEE